MRINKERGIGKFFFWALGICEAFTDRSLAYKYEHHTNLCHFVRVALFYAPIILLLQILFWAYAITALVIIPAYLFGFMSFLKTFGIVVGGIVALFLALIVIDLVVRMGYNGVRDWMKDFWYEHRHAPTLLTVVVEWAKAKKQRICPIVNFEGGDQNA
jgi:hypothetical protein